MKQIDGRKLSPSAQEALRFRIGNFLSNHKGTQRQAAETFQVSISAIEKIWKQFEVVGRAALTQKKRGPQASQSSLSAKQIKSVTAIVKKDTPDQRHIPRYLWTAAAVRQLIKKKSVLAIVYVM